MSQAVINPKAINTEPIRIDHSGDSVLETSGALGIRPSESAVRLGVARASPIEVPSQQALL
jgi:hypothetical protein